MIENPALRGFNPDPSAISTDSGFYIATSTFEWFPGICVYHSTDLANWTLVDTPVKDLSLLGAESSGGLWAPHLSYADGLFWLAVTVVRTRRAFKDTLNYIMTAKAIGGEWSAPRFANASGFDPSLFHDDDGKKYFLNMLWDYRPGHSGFAGILMQELDGGSMALIGERKLIYGGTGLGVAEGPQIFKKDGFYYLVTAAGGTGYMHAAAIARSACVWGPYETSPNHPLLTSAGYPENPLQKSGHASFFKSGDEWLIAHICARPLSTLGNCVLGRETALQRIEWKDGWPHLAHGGKAPALRVDAGTGSQRTDFSEFCGFDDSALPLSLQSLRVPLGRFASLSERPGWLRLYGRESIMSLHEQTLVARRWQSFSFRAETRMDFKPGSFQQMAGLALFYNTENFFCLYKSARFSDGLPSLSLMVCEHGEAKFDVEEELAPEGEIWLSAEVEREEARFGYSLDGKSWRPIGSALSASHLSDDHIGARHLVFTGAMIALCCQDLNDRTAYADFDYLDYRERQQRAAL
jgi:xylan 1,4-beta-xylosidase